MEADCVGLAEHGKNFTLGIENPRPQSLDICILKGGEGKLCVLYAYCLCQFRLLYPKSPKLRKFKQHLFFHSSEDWEAQYGGPGRLGVW